MIILYHDNCADGFCAAWVAHKKFPDAEFVAVQYDEPPPDVQGKDVLIVDFSYDLKTLTRMAEHTKSIRLYDHHKTAIQELSDVPYCVLDPNKSGGRLTWEGLFPNEDPPWIVQYTEDRDLWRWQLPESREVSAAIKSYPFSFAQWDMHITHGRTELVKEGIAILRYQTKLVEDLSQHTRALSLGGYTVPAVNSPILQSEIGERISIGQPFGAVWCQLTDGRRLFSLRSEKPDGIDVSTVAKKFGGGGHKHAAGFHVASHEKNFSL